MDDAAAARIEALLQTDIDWTYMLEMGWRHGMRPLLYTHLGTAYPDRVPAPARDQLRRAVKAETAHTLMLTGELLKIVNVLHDQGIEVLPYKGPAWAMQSYGSVALRPFVDIDLLVRRRDVLRAGELLGTLGYQAKYLSEATAPAFLRFQYNDQFFIEEGSRLVEMHWAVLPHYFAFSFDTDRFWDRASTVELMGRPLPTLSREDALLVHCAHGTKHYWERLEWIVSLAAFIEANETIDWADVLERAEHIGGTRMLCLGLLLTERLLDAAIPEEVAEVVARDPVAPRLVTHVAGRLFREDGSTLGSGKTFFHMKARERMRDKIRYAVRFVTQPGLQEVDLILLPSFLFPLYYLLRPLRLFGELSWKHLKHVWSRLVSRRPAQA